MIAARLARIVVLAALGIFAAGEVSAQLGGYPGGTGGRRGGTRGGQSDSARDRGPAQREATDLFQTTLEELRIDLKLAPEQGPAWDAYAEKVQAFRSDLARQRSRADATAKLNAIQQLDRMVDAERNRVTAMEEIAAAANALYGALTPEQKSVADRRLANVASAAGQYGERSTPGTVRTPSK